jgi:hypothetical protein
VIAASPGTKSMEGIYTRPKTASTKSAVILARKRGDLLAVRMVI